MGTGDSVFLNDTATTEIYTLSLHDALPIAARDGRPRRCAGSRARLGRSLPVAGSRPSAGARPAASRAPDGWRRGSPRRSEEHTSELPSRQYLVCRLLLEKNTTHSSHYRSST